MAWKTGCKCCIFYSFACMFMIILIICIFEVTAEIVWTVVKYKNDLILSRVIKQFDEIKKIKIIFFIKVITTTICTTSTKTNKKFYILFKTFLSCWENNFF